MKRRLVVTRRAYADLVEIGAFIARDSPRAADRLMERLTTAGENLVGTPGMGRPDASDPNRRIDVVGNYLIIYKVDPDEIRVLRCVHGRRRRTSW